MNENLKLKCRCGKVQASAEVSTETGCHTVCYCQSCQAFAHYLGCSGELLDAQGGVDLFLTSPARIKFGSGSDQLACVRLTEKGPLRWYTKCCNTPVGSTVAAAGFPFFGMLPGLLADPAEANAAMGPVLGAFFPEASKADKADLVKGGKTPKSMFAKFGWRMLKARVRGDHKHSAFRDAVTGELLAEPKLLDKTERDALYAKV